MPILSLFVLGAALGSSPESHASSCKLPDGAKMFAVRYVDDGDFTKDSPLCDVTAQGHTCKLSGWVYKPKGAGPFPAVVVNHSDENPREESTYCELTERFVKAGYVVFQPLRRGYRGDAGIGLNTGERPAATLLAGAAAKSPVAATLKKECTQSNAAKKRDCGETILAESQTLELTLAVEYLTTLSSGGTRWVDSKRVAVLGDAEGAVITALLADRQAPAGARIRAGVLLSTADRDWDSDHPLLKKRLVRAVEQRRFPLAYVQAKNAESIGSTEELADTAVETQDLQLMATLVPSMNVATWAPLAQHFLELHGVGEAPKDEENPKDGKTHATVCDRLEPGTKVSVERYYDPAQRSADDPLCTETKGNVSCNLSGMLYVPKNAAKAPAILLNNGGDAVVRSEGGFCTMIEYFNRHGFVVFVPRRRGVIEREPKDPSDHLAFVNTGEDLRKVVTETKEFLAGTKKGRGSLPRAAEPYARTCHLRPGDPKQDTDCLEGELLRAEAVELGHAIAWLKRARPNAVDPNKVAILGHSNGGQLVIHAGATLDGDQLPAAVIAISPHEKGWNGNKYKGELLEVSVKAAKAPLTILRPANAPNVHSTQALGKVAAHARKRFMTAVLPPMPIPPGEDSPDDFVHVKYVQDHAQVAKWATAARRFMKIYGVD